MTFPEDVLARVGIFILGTCGFLVARHIYNRKKNAHGVLSRRLFVFLFFSLPLRLYKVAVSACPTKKIQKSKTSLNLGPWKLGEGWGRSGARGRGAPAKKAKK